MARTTFSDKRGSWSIVSAGLISVAILLVGCTKHDQPAAVAPVNSTITVHAGADAIHIDTKTAQFVFLSNGYLKSSLKNGPALLTLDGASPASGQRVSVAGQQVADFIFDLSKAAVTAALGKLGTAGKQIKINGHSPSTGLTEILTIEVFDDFPEVVLLSAAFRNGGNQPVALDAVSLAGRDLDAKQADPAAASYQMWSFHGSSLKWGKDDVLLVSKNLDQENPLGAPVESGDDLGRVGGGIPVVAFWTRNVGEAVGHVETLPLALSIPVKTEADGHVHAAVRVPAIPLTPGEVFSTPRTFVAVFAGDFYGPLSLWSRMVDREGLSRPANNPENYAVSWCGWGYQSNVTPKQMVDTIPKLKTLGIHWATLDDRWFDNYGDWQPRADTFPGDSIQKLVKDFHQQGVKVQIWWLPLAAENGQGHYGEHGYMLSNVVKEHPDWLVLDQQGKPALMTRNLPTLCPAVPEVREYYKKLTERFIRDWDFDGHKLDNIYSTPRCYNPKHHHKSPMDSVYAMGDVYKTIFETTRALKPDSVTQSCPCGTPPSVAWFRYMDQAVTADPVGAVQVRRRIKMYKALLGPNSAIYGDHVELSRMVQKPKGEMEEIGSDFASTLGTGGVLGTKFTWPDYGPKFKNVVLTQEKETYWKKWIGIYNQKMLSQGEFRNLYVYGYDDPEAYAIAKDGKMYYAFFAPKWKGDLELRGLGPGQYRVVDYTNGKEYGTVSGPTSKLTAQFSDNLLLEVSPTGQ